MFPSLKRLLRAALDFHTRQPGYTQGMLILLNPTTGDLRVHHTLGLPAQDVSYLFMNTWVHLKLAEARAA